MNKTIIKILPLIFLISAFLPLEYSSIVCTISIITISLAYPYLLKKIFNKFFLIIILISLIFYPLLTSQKDSTLLLINYSSSSLIQATKIIVRATLILISFNLFIVLSKNFNINKFWQKMGVRSFDEVYRISNELMPSAIDSLQNSIMNNKKITIKYALLHPIHFFSEVLANFIHNSMKKFNNHKYISSEE